MATKKEEEKKDLTGLETATNRRDAEYDLTEALLKAAEFRNSDDAITDVDIKRNGAVAFTVRVRPLSDTEARKARKLATTMMANPQGRKYPQIEKSFDSALFNSHLIYMATVEEDQKNIWGNKKVMDKFDILNPWETVDLLLAVGEKLELVDVIMDISGMNGEDEEVAPEEYAKN